MKYDFLNSPVTRDSSKSSPRTFLRDKETFPASYEEAEVDDDQKQLVDMLEQYLTICDNESKPSTSSSTAADHSSITLDYQELIDKLQRHLRLGLSPSTSSSVVTTPAPFTRREGVHFEGDHIQKSLSETLNRYFSHSPRRHRIISDLLTNRKVLEKLYFDLHKTKGFQSRRDYQSTGASRSFAPWDQTGLLKHQPGKFERSLADFKKSAPPPLIEIQGESNEITHVDIEAQTFPIAEAEFVRCDKEYRKQLSEQDEEARDNKYGSRRRSSVDHDDVSQSVSDTIKRYLRMARKKSVDSDKADKFKRVNYDRNLRNIKAKGEITKPGDDDGLHKGCQTNDDWILTYRDLIFDEYNPECNSRTSSVDATDIVHKTSPAVSPTSPKTHQSFLSQLLHHKDKVSTSSAAGPATAAAATTPAGPQKSKSSSSVMHQGGRLIAKKMFRSRSKSQTRPGGHVPCSWTPQSCCVWTSVTGKQVILTDTTLLQLTEVERKMLQKVAIAKLQALNLGVTIKVPADSVGAQTSKPKRRPYLLKRKALTTGIFDTGRKDSDSGKDKDSAGGPGLVFGIPLSQCIENERNSRRNSGTVMTGSARQVEEPSEINRVSSKSSFTSLIEQSRASDEKGSCESLMSPVRERMVGSVPGLLDTLGCESTGDLPVAILTVEDEPAVPNIINTCIRYLECYGMRTLGIFRVSTSKKRIRQLREDFDCGKDSFVEDEQTPHDVATLLKEYLRDLPDPLLCRDLYQAFVQTQRIRNRKLQHEALQHLIQLLPAANRDTLWTLLQFLSTVARNAPDQRDSNTGDIVPGNKMDANNLATVFAPNILHCIKAGSGKDVANDKPEDRLDIINVIRAMIDQNKTLYSVPCELLDEVYVHMMDLHPEALDHLLNSREGNAEGSLDDLDSESQSNSAPWTPTALTSDVSIEHALETLQDEPVKPRRTYSREEFLHESAATGGPNIGMRIRSKDRMRERGLASALAATTKKRREESSTRRKQQHDESLMATYRHLYRGGGSRGDDGGDGDPNMGGKVRSSSLDSNTSQTDSVCSEPVMGQSSRVLRDSRDQQRGGVITASLTIPVGGQPLSVINPANIEDIPFIEDAIEPGKQHITIGLVKTPPAAPPSAPPRDRDRRQLIHQQIQRQRSMSGESDSSTSITVGSIILHQQPMHQQQQQHQHQQQGSYDSAVGSSATYSSPPHNTTPSSISGSSIQDGGVYSSPPSWASTPPTSPDSQGRAVNYIPEDYHSKDKAAAAANRRSLTGQEDPKPTTTTTARKLSGSSKEAVTGRKEQYTTAITSIGNAVLRSRTADFERISKADDTRTKPTMSTATSAGNKKYTKRRYTDSRHQTRHIPDSDTLDNTQQQLYKRKELISSVLSTK